MRHFQVTLTTSGTAYSLHTLIKAISATWRDDTKQVIIQSDDGNSTNSVFIGGAGVSTTAYGVKLVAANDSVSLDTPQVAGIWAVPGANSLLLNITMVP